MIQVNSLTKTYGKVEAVRGVSFAVSAGEVYALLGPNGAGKSTIINIISGLLQPSSGTVTVGGYDIARQPIDAKRRLGVVPQQSVVIEELTAMQNCMFFGSLYGLKDKELAERSRELLNWIELSDHLNKPAGSFSGGLLRRLTLVLGILHRPTALMLDEPTVGLDPQTRLLMLEAVQEIARGGTAVLLTTHYMDEAERICDRVGIIDNGEIIKEGTLADLRAAVEDVQIFSLRGRIDRAAMADFVASLAGAEVVHEEEGEIVLSLSSHARVDASRLLETAATMENITEVAIKPPSLESLFIRLTGRNIRE